MEYAARRLCVVPAPSETSKDVPPVMCCLTITDTVVLVKFFNGIYTEVEGPRAAHVEISRPYLCIFYKLMLYESVDVEPPDCPIPGHLHGYKEFCRISTTIDTLKCS